MKPLREFLAKMTRAQKIQLAIAAVVLIAVVVVLVVLMNRTTYSMLYTGLEASEAGQINTRLTEMGINTRLESGGTTIMVPEKDVNRLRLELAAEGLPKSGDTYEYYRSSLGMNSTDYDKRVASQQQLEIDLAKSIETFPEVESAQVRLQIPQGTSMIKSETKKKSGTVFLTMIGSDRLEQKKVDAILFHVAGGSELEVSEITISDNLGNTYKNNSESGVGLANTQIDTEREASQHYENIIYNLMEPVIGDGHFTAKVDLTMNWDVVLEETTDFTQPEGSMDEGGLAVAIKKAYEATGMNETAEGEPGIDSNGGSVPEYQETLDATDSSYVRQEEQINNELNEANMKIQHANGQVTDIRASITIDETLDIEDYTAVYQELVANALRTKTENVVVHTVPYIDESEAQQAAIDEYNAQLKAMQTQKLIRTILIVLGILGSVFLLAKVIRDVSRNNLEAKRAQAAAVAKYTDKAMAGGSEDPGTIDEDSKRPERMQIEDFIERSPESVAQLLRNWISEDMR